jgi:hypothetical protein
MTTRILTTAKGMTIETTLTDGEALEALAQVPGSFAADLRSKARRYGLSRDQFAWVHKLAIEHQAKTAGAATPGASTRPAFPGIAKLFRHAAEHKTYPKVHLMMADGTQLRLSLCGSKSKYAGSITLTDGGSYPNNKFYGRLDGETGAHTGTAPAAVLSLLAAFDADPAAVALNQGAGSDRCCFCQTELDTIESRAKGYGPTCANNWGLPWDGSNNKTAKARKPRKARVARGAAPAPLSAEALFDRERGEAIALNLNDESRFSSPDFRRRTYSRFDSFGD